MPVNFNMKFIRNIALSLILIIFFLVSFNVYSAFAAPKLGDWGTFLKDSAVKTGGIYKTDYPAGENTALTIAKYVGTILIIAPFLGMMLVIRLVWAGYQWMTAKGNDEKVAEAQKTITHAVVGIVIMIALYIIAYFIVDKLTYISGYKGF